MKVIFYAKDRSGGYWTVEEHTRFLRGPTYEIVCVVNGREVSRSSLYHTKAAVLRQMEGILRTLQSWSPDSEDAAG